MEVREISNEEYEMFKKSLGNRRSRYKLQTMLDKFIFSEAKGIEFIMSPGEYKSVSTALTTLWKACQRSGYRCRPVRIGDRIFIVKDE